MRHVSIQIILTLLISFHAGASIHLDKIKLPPGFKISVFSNKIPGARSMVWGAKGTLFVGSRQAGKVYAIKPNGQVRILAEGLNQPNGVAFRNGSLYVAEIHRLIQFENIEANLDRPNIFTILTPFPSETTHGWKYMAFGPDDRLYVTQGSPCNVCVMNDPYGTIQSYNSAGKDPQTIARGIRNSVGFDWQPKTKNLWFTDNGRDYLGDDVPPDELNMVSKPGLHFGFPYCHAGEILDPSFGVGRNCADYEAPKMKLGPHVAALGLRFYTGNKFPPSYANQILIAEHGSWNRSTPIGYRISMVTFDVNGTATNYKVFAQGWLQGGSAWGRPVDIINSPDGSILVSDDQAGAIYKIQYQK